MKNRLDQDFTLGGLLRFALPTTIMMLVTSLYTIVDGVLTSRLVGENALAAINIAYPAVSIVLAMGIMLGTGGSAVVSHRMGTGDLEGARRTFGFLAVTAVCAGVCFALLAAFGAEPLARLLGASDLLLADTVCYLRILLMFTPMAMLQLLFESFFVAAGKPGLGLGLTIAAGVTNGVLDWLYMGPLQMGIAGAAVATVTGYCIPAVCGVVFFLTRKEGLRFGRPRLDWRLLGRACFNGSSEMVTNLSTAVTTFFFNAIMMELLGEPGVAAVTIVLYAQFLLVALFLGFSMGVAPVFSFNQGAERYDRLRATFRHCARFILCAAVGILAAALALAPVIVGVFSPAGTQVHALALEGFHLFAPTFLFAGVNIFASALFTALSDGRTSALISFARTFGFLMAGLLLLPRIMGVTGVWIAVPVAEAVSCLLSIGFLWHYRAKFGYGAVLS
ncbi:MATE family efflux transporter [uncultured Flavonifractor sp.]|uniref:MATE family efflux transporter n=1 Tax=uncultured Flavonifractor sp. TaxID=1193534 RepID=UPI00261948BB|nr:MATE family efflux transporter [uncultured Flavonifractor sp.]